MTIAFDAYYPDEWSPSYYVTYTYSIDPISNASVYLYSNGSWDPPLVPQSSLFSITYVWEFIFDIMFTCNIILTFFTAIQSDIDWKFDLNEIAKTYIKNSFFFDCISTFPALFTFPSPSLYYLKIARFIHFKGFQKKINENLNKLFNKCGLNKHVIERIIYFMVYNISF
jgi:hypothetical protein